MSETTFENAKVNDRVYSPLFKSVNIGDKTNAVILSISDSFNFPIIIEPDVENIAVYRPAFTSKGEFWVNAGQVLFWENPIREIPSLPKILVKKSGYMGISYNATYAGGMIARTSNIFTDAVEVKELSGLKYQIIPIEFEVEE